MMTSGAFTISLDFELYWGVRDGKTLKQYGENIKNVHVVIPQILDLFKKYDIHATWCIVGFLFFENKQQLLENLPAKLPAYKSKSYDPYDYITNNELESTYHFAPACIELIKNTPNQEIGTHTFSHYYCLEDGQTIDQFKADILSAIKACEASGIDCKSLIFPRNQYNNEYLSAAKELGIKYYRGTEASAYYQPKKKDRRRTIDRILRLADSYINLSGHNIFRVQATNNTMPINIPASRFLRPYSSRLSFFEHLRLKRIASSMKKAAIKNSVYHLWWHPHNFGKDIQKNLNFLEDILMYYQKLKQEYKFQSCAMNGLVDSTILQG